MRPPVIVLLKAHIYKSLCCYRSSLPPVHVISYYLHIQCYPFQPWRLDPPSKWSGTWLGTSLRLIATSHIVFVSVVGECIALDDIHCYPLHLCLEGCFDFLWSMRFLYYQCFLCFFGEHQCNSLCVRGIFFFMTAVPIVPLLRLISAVHLVSLNPSICRSYLSISSKNLIAFLVSHTVRTSQVLMLIVALVVRRRIDLLTSKETQFPP